MPILEVLNPGFQSSLQDLGRPGYTHLGISPGGAADPVALRLENRLVSNPESAAAIEMTLSGANFRFLRETWIALAGAECRATLNGQPLAMWSSFHVKAGDLLILGSITNGARTYLSVHGGFSGPTFLGSRSAFVTGGWQGELLSSGVQLLGADLPSGVSGYHRATIGIRSLYRRPTGRIRVTRGRQWEWFTETSRKSFLRETYEVTSEADRKGLRLSGPTLERVDDRELVTEGIGNGTIQGPGGGQPLILHCEQQTTGGYPRIANVIRADLFLLGQLAPGMKIRFEEVSLEEAWRINSEREKTWAKAVLRA